MAEHRYPSVGKCIYCGTEELPEGLNRFGDEHIVPFAFGGNLILPESSCRECERVINREIESPILSQEWGDFRAARNFPTRRRKSRTKYKKLRRKNGSFFKMQISDYSAPTPLYLFSEARIFEGIPAGMDEQRWTLKFLSDGDEEMACREKYPDWDGKHIFKTRPYEFARLIAKIGYAYASAELGLGTFEPSVTDIILGRDDDYFYWVGGTWEIPPPATSGGSHTFELHFLVRKFDILVIVNIRLFSQTETPIYHAVIGRILFDNPEHMAAFEQHRLNGKLEEMPSDK